MITSIVVLLFLSTATLLEGDSGAPVEKKVYRSASAEFELEVDPRWNASYTKLDPCLTLKHLGETVWRRSPDDFELFHFPMHALVSDDGRHVVFGGYSVHNLGNDQEGLRLYDSSGRLVRFISRRDLPPGEYSVSTAHWFDEERTVIEAGTLYFYTPNRERPITFDLETGRASPEGAIEAGQGDDEVRWREHLRKLKDPGT